jgi:hypothetical protein
MRPSLLSLLQYMNRGIDTWTCDTSFFIRLQGFRFALFRELSSRQDSPVLLGVQGMHILRGFCIANSPEFLG